MLKDHIRKQFQERRDYLECAEYKTSQYYGTLGKHLFPGTIKAIKIYIDLAGKALWQFLVCLVNKSLHRMGPTIKIAHKALQGPIRTPRPYKSPPSYINASWGTKKNAHQGAG